MKNPNQNRIKQAALVLMSVDPFVGQSLISALSEEEKYLLHKELDQLSTENEKEQQNALTSFANVLFSPPSSKSQLRDSLDSLQQKKSSSPLPLSSSNPSDLAAFFQEQEPMATATILSLLPEEQTASILRSCPLPYQITITQAIIDLSKINPSEQQEILKLTQNSLGGLPSTRNISSIGGFETVERILSHYPDHEAQTILRTLQDENPAERESINNLAQ